MCLQFGWILRMHSLLFHINTYNTYELYITFDIEAWVCVYAG